ncbi:hypothetical protein D9M71_794930 [compost metagenome]
MLTLSTCLVSPLATLSTSLSLASTLPVALLPGVPLLTPPASRAVLPSSWAMGVSLRPSTVICSSALEEAPKTSVRV